MSELPTPLSPIDEIDACIARIGGFLEQRLPLRTLLERTDAEADTCASRVVASLSEKDVACLTRILVDRRNRLPLSTGITDQIVGICQQILAFGAGGLALSLFFVEKAAALSLMVRKLLAIGGLFYVQLVFLSLWVLLIYMLQARFRYPFLYFTRIGNTRPYFYYASIDERTPRDAIQTDKAFRLGATTYAQDFLRFTRWALSEDDRSRLRNELQQYFLLVSYQGYVNQFSLRLVSQFTYGFFGALASTAMLAVAAFLIL